MYTLEDLKKFPQEDTQIKHHFSDNVYAKEMTLAKGCVAMSHKHTYSHLSVLALGSCIVSTMEDGKEITTAYNAPSVIEIKAGVEHQIEATQDLVWLCIHGTTEKDAAKIDEVAIATV